MKELKVHYPDYCGCRNILGVSGNFWLCKIHGWMKKTRKNKMKAYYYHENSNSIFIDWFLMDFGPVENEFVHRIGICFKENSLKDLKRAFHKWRKKYGVEMKLSQIEYNLNYPDLPF